MTRDILLIIISIQLAWMIYRMEWRLWRDRETEHFWKLVTPPVDKAVSRYFSKKGGKNDVCVSGNSEGIRSSESSSRTPDSPS